MSEARKAGSSANPVIPDKLYFRIGEVARLLAVEPHTLRFWESEFPQLRINKGGSGQRLYRRKDVETALAIKHLLYDEGYTIPGARQLLQARARRKDLPELPFPSGAPELRPAGATSEARTAGTKDAPLQRIRSELRAISALLSRPPAKAAGTERDRGKTARELPASRRGLHLATRRSALGPQAASLFGRNSD